MSLNAVSPEHSASLAYFDVESLCGVQQQTLDGARFDDIGGQRRQTGFRTKPKTQALHPSKQTPLPVPDSLA